MVMDKVKMSNSTYVIGYQINPTSRMSDYDYSFDQSKRFISSYIHELIIYDLITNQILSKIKFSTDTSYNIINGLKDLITKSFTIRTIRNTYIEYDNIPAVESALTLERENRNEYIITIISKDATVFRFDENQIQSLIVLMETKNSRLYEE